MEKLFRLLSPLIAPLRDWYKKLSAERTAAKGCAYSPIEESDNETFERLGASSAWEGVREQLTRLFVQSKAFSHLHVTEWFDLPDTQPCLRQLADTVLTSAEESSDDRMSLVDSYMRISGLDHTAADAFVNLTVNVLVAGRRGAVKDQVLGAQIETSMRALQNHLNVISSQLNAQVLPEPGWSLDVAYKANVEWLLNAFSSREKAKIRFGQPLSPAENTASVNPIARTAKIKRVSSLLSELPFGGVVALIGDEGNGKSWLAAQTWLSVPAKPLTLFVTAEDLSEQINDLLAFITNKLCVQTDRQGSERHQKFWSNQLNIWRAQGSGPSQGFLVVLDGLNQRPRIEWARLIDQLSDELSRISGKLIITSRKRYFSERVKPRLVSPCREVIVSEWSTNERDILLATRNIHASQLCENVAAALCNPRLLYIALTLLGNSRLQAMGEISIPLLLFEHLHASQRDSYGQSAADFSRNLQEHAKTVLQRLNSQQRDDLRVFDGGLDSVAEGRFFKPLPEDPTRYTVSEDGLGLALGLAIIEELQKAKRNNRDLNETLSVLAEPISALDQTSEAFLAALTIVCMSEENPTEIGATILLGFAGLQNLDDDKFGAITALARIRPQIFLEAAHTLALQSGKAVNFDWIELALHHARADEHAWPSIMSAINGWLIRITLAVEKNVFPFGKSTEEIVENRAKMKGELEGKLARLSLDERCIFDELVTTTAQDISTLGKVALKLLAGKPLVPFAQALVHWNFARVLNGSYDAPLKEFRQLIRFNSVDWEATREQLLLLSQMLRHATTSRVGKRTLASLLEATGHPDDALHANKIVEELWPERMKQIGWSILEKYCKTDPCNPNNEEPDNVGRTAEQYACIDVSKLHLRMGMDTLDLFFSDARPAVTRFYPDTAIERHRTLANDVLQRYGPPLRQGVVNLLDHAALITHEQAHRFVRRVCGSAADITAQDSLGNEADIWAQFQLQLAFPALEAQEQLDALILGRFGDKLSLNLIDLIKPLDTPIFEDSLARSVAAQNDEEQSIVLLFTPFINQPLSSATYAQLTILLSSQSTMVRAHTLRMIARSTDTEALRCVIQSGWLANQMVDIGNNERWFGSEVLIEAAIQGVAPWNTLVANIDHQHLGRLSKHLGGDAAQYVANVVNECLQRSLELSIDTGALELEIMQHPNADAQMPYFRLNEREPPSNNFEDAFQRYSESHERFNERQRNLHAAFSAMHASLSSKKANWLLDQFSMKDFAAIAAIDNSLEDRWCALLLEQSNNESLKVVRNIGLLLASTIGAREPVCAVQLFKKFEPITPLVRVVFGRAAIELGAMAIWATSDTPELYELRALRLDSYVNNNALAHEVWAALWNGKSSQLEKYIDERLVSAWPAAQARAIMVAGLMGQNPHSDSVLKRFADVSGFLGDTQRVAREVYERHAWALHWHSIMRRAQSEKVFWQAAILFLAVADGRIEALRLSEEVATPLFCLHWPSIERQLQNRFNKLQNKWKERLFADEAAFPVFLRQQEQGNGVSFPT